MNRRRRPLTVLLAVLLALQPAMPSPAAKGDEGAAEPPPNEAAAGPESVDPEAVDPEVVDPEVADPEVVDPEMVEPTKETAAKPQPGDDPSVFIPSEEISEDFAVSFPVDI